MFLLLITIFIHIHIQRALSEILANITEHNIAKKEKKKIRALYDRKMKRLEEEKKRALQGDFGLYQSQSKCARLTDYNEDDE
jgi:glycogen synthase